MVLKAAADLLAFDGTVDEKGKQTPRTRYPKKHLRSVQTLREKIIESTEVVLVPKDKEQKDLVESDLTYVPAKDFVASSIKDDQKVLGERTKELETDFTDGEKSMLKDFASERDEVPALSMEELDNFKEAFGFDLAA